MTKEQFIALNPCKEALTWALAQPSLIIAWETCHRSDWMWWLLQKTNISKEISVKYANWCAKSVTHVKNKAATTAAYAAANAANAANAAYSAYAAAYAAAAAAYAADTYDRKNQADFLRSIVPNPFFTPIYK